MISGGEWIKIRGPARVLRLDDGSQLSSEEILSPLDRVSPSLDGDVLSDYLDEAQTWQVSGGVITLRLLDRALFVETQYSAAGRLSDDQCLSLLDYTAWQWSSGFNSCCDGLGPRGTTVSIWDSDSLYELEVSWQPGVRRVSWTLVEEPRPHRVAAFV